MFANTHDTNKFNPFINNEMELLLIKVPTSKPSFFLRICTDSGSILNNYSIIIVPVMKIITLFLLYLRLFLFFFLIAAVVVSSLVVTSRF